MKKALFFVLAILLLGLPAVAEVTDNIRVPIEMTVYVDCSGDLLTLSGDLHMLFTYTANANGVHGSWVSNPQGVSGTGSNTGAVYHATGLTRGVFSFNGKGPYTDTFINNFRMISGGQAPNLQIHENAHITVAADGTVKVFVDNVRVTCQ